MRSDRGVVLGTLLGALSVVAPAHADSVHEAVVWYRASQQCPSGTQFLAKLSQASVRFKLADAGDHIDFVVTLVVTGESTVGRLERQTQGGTVAIRELRDSSCAHVSDALALSLDLAQGPMLPSSAAHESPAPVVESNPDAERRFAAESATDESAAPAATSMRPTTTTERSVRPQIALKKLEERRPRVRRWSVGAEGGLLLGVAPSALARASVFADARPVLTGIATGLALRFAVVGAFGSPETPVGALSYRIFAGRAELCPWRWGGARVGVQPCLGFELGSTSASGNRATGQRAGSLWAAPGAGGRVRVGLAPEAAIEVGVGALRPLVRNAIYAGSTRLYDSSSVAFAASLALALGPF